MTSQRRRVILCGFDGATWSILRPMLDKGLLENLGKMIADGASGDLRSTLPAVTAPAWTTCVTGVNPGKHGVFGFFTRDPRTLQPRYLSASSIRVPTLWQRLGRADRRVAVVNVPTTYPPERVNGAMITGFLTPRGRDFAYPQELQDRLVKEGYRIAAPLPRKGALPTDIALRWLTDLYEVTMKRTETVLDLQKDQDPDFTMVVYMTPDLIQHTFYKFLDPTQPHHDSERAAELRGHLERCYQALDHSLDAFRSSLRDDDLLIVCSDHGFAPLQGRIYLNRWLAKAGYLKTKRAALVRYETSRIVRTKAAMRIPMLRGRWGGPEAFADTYIDRQRSHAFAGEPAEFAIHAVSADPPLDDIARDLLELRHPTSGEPLIEDVIPRADCYSGPYVEEAPALLLRMVGDEHGLNNRLWGRKPGIYVPKPGPVGTHSRSGVILAAGAGTNPGARLDASLQDIAPTVLYAMGLDIPSSMDGRVIDGLFSPGTLDASPPRIVDDSSQADGAEPEDAYTPEEADEIAARLADLGYIE